MPVNKKAKMVTKPLEVENSSEEKNDSGYSKTFLAELVKQINIEYALAYDSQKSKIAKRLEQLKLYNNQKRDNTAVGDPLVFTIHQTLLSSLYDDRLMVNFEGWEEGDEETADNLNALAEFDYDLMQKDVVDYFWLWDTLFFGRGLIRVFEFDRDKRFMCPVPENIDIVTFLRDPNARSVNGDAKAKGQMRFGGRELNIPKRMFTKENGYFSFDTLQLGTEVKSLLKDAQDARDNAQGRDQLKDASEADLGDNANVPTLEWRTIKNNKKYIVYLTNGKSNVVKIQEIGHADKSTWDLVDRPMYPTSQDWDGVSVIDLVEDKQRARSVMLNLGIQATKGDIYPMYLFDESRVKNKADLVNFQNNKFVAITGEGDVRGAVQPMNKATPKMDVISFVLETLDVSAQKATATPEMQQGSISSEKRTLGELNLVASKVDTRYSLSAKVFGWSERAFWQKWYQLYKEHFKSGIDKKLVRVRGSYGTKWRELTSENIIAVIDPDIKIESKVVSENKNVKDRILLNQFGQLVLADPTANKMFFMRKLAKLNGLDRDDIMRLYPQTIDEMVAEKENDELNEDKLVIVSPNDEDLVHMEVHAKAKESNAKSAHIEAHMASMMIKRQQPELFNPAQVNEAEALNGQNAPVSVAGGTGQGAMVSPSQAVSPTQIPNG